MSYSSAYWPPRAISSSWRADLDDARAVEHDDQVGHPHGREAVRDQHRDAAVGRRRSRARGGVALEQRVLGLGVERGGRLVEHEQQRRVAHEAARQRQLLPLAERHLDAAGPGRAELGVEARRRAARPRRRRRPGRRPRRPPARRRGAAGRRGRRSAARGSSKRKKSWNAPASRVAPLVGGRCAPAATPSTRIRAGGRLVHLGEQLDERATCRRRSRRRPRRPRRPAGRASTSSSTSRSVPGRRTTRASKRMPSVEPVGRRQVGGGAERGGVVLEPGQPPRAVQPDAAQEADLADRRADVRRQPRAGGEHEQHVAGRRVEPDGDEDDRADVRRRRRPPTRACARRRVRPARRARSGAYQRSHAARRSRDEPRRRCPVTRTSLPGGAVVASGEEVRAPGGRAGAPRSWAARSTPGRQRRGQHGRQREDARAAPAPGGSTSAARR